MNAVLLPFPLGLVEGALLQGTTLYVRTVDAVARATRSGVVTVLQTFTAQSPLGFKGLVALDGHLFTLDRPLRGTPVLTRITPDAPLRRFPELGLRQPTALAVVGGHLVVLDGAPPVTRMKTLDQGRVLAEARNLTAWRQGDGDLTFSDQGGLHRLGLGGLSTLLARRGVLAFDQQGHVVIQEVQDGRPVFTVTTPDGSQVVTGVNRPVALHSLAAGPFVRFSNRVAPVACPADLQDLPDAADLGTVTTLAGGLVYLGDDRQVHWSADARHWTCQDPGVHASEIVPVGETDLIVTGRRASTWLSTPSSGPTTRSGTSR